MLMQEAEDTYYRLCMSKSRKKLVDKRKVMARSSSKTGVFCCAYSYYKRSTIMMKFEGSSSELPWVVEQ